MQPTLQASPRPATLRARTIRWLAIAIVLLSLLALATMLFGQFGDHEQAPAQDSLLALVLAAAVSGAGLVLLAWIVVSFSRASATVDRSMVPAFTGIEPPALDDTTRPETKDVDANNLSMLQTLTRSGYWTASIGGAYVSVDPAHDDTQWRLKELIGNRRESLAADAASLEQVRRIARLVGGHQPFRVSYWRCQLPNGQLLSLRESGLPRYDRQGQFAGYHGYIEDVSAQALDPIRTQLVTQALEVLPLPLALLQREQGPAEVSGWKLVWANAPLTDLTGRSQIELGDLQPQQWLLCAPATEDTDAPVAPTRKSGPVLTRLLNQDKTHRGDGLVIDRYGTRKPVLLTLERINSGHPSNHLVLVSADPDAATLRSLKARAAQVSLAEKEAARRALEVEITARELESFSHTVSHDLRHPLRIVDGFARILQEDYSPLFDRTGNEHVNRILSAANRMNSMIDALVDLHGISSQPLSADPVALTALVQSIVDELQSVKPKDHPVDISVEPGMSCRGDRVLLRLALFNLIENAWKYSANKPDATISVDTVMLHDTRVYRVTDNGAGFDPRFADRLFELFHRLHGQSEFEGSGVGLATVQRIIRRHGGRIWADSTPDEGACFQFTLWDNSVENAVTGQSDPDPQPAD